MDSMFTPYEIERRILYYVEDSSQKPLIRDLINEAVQYVCQATEPGRDWSFLVATESFSLPVGEMWATKVFRLPPRVRSVISASASRCVCDIHGRDIIIKVNAEETPPSSLSVSYYKAQPVISKLVEPIPSDPSQWQYDPAGNNAAWTATNPPSSILMLPQEAMDVIVYRTLKLMSVHEIEVATNIQFLDQMVETGLQFLRTNYQLQIDYKVPLKKVADPSGDNEELTVGWLVNYAKSIIGGERSEYQLISMVNKCASDMADYLRLRGSQRPTPVNALSESLPKFGAVDGQRLYKQSGTLRAIPSQYWMEAMKFQCLRATKQADEMAVREYTDSLKSLSDLFYSLATDGCYGNATYGDAMNHLRSIWKNQRSDEVLWSALNTCIANVMRAINTGETLTKHDYTATYSVNDSFDLPEDFKVAVKVVNSHGKEIICRPFTARGRIQAEQDMWQFPDERRGPHPNAFMIAGKKLLFEKPLPAGYTVSLYYYPKHVWPFVTDASGKKSFDYSAPLPVDWDLLCLNLEARVALESGDGNKYGALKTEFNEAVIAHNEAQNRSLSEDARMIAATPTVDFILACNRSLY